MRVRPEQMLRDADATLGARPDVQALLMNLQFELDVTLKNWPIVRFANDVAQLCALLESWHSPGEDFQTGRVISTHLAMPPRASFSA